MIDITVSPVSINATLNSTVTFTCEAVADEITFLVDNTQAIINIIKNRGFTQRITGIGTVTGLLNATAYQENNATNVECRAITLNSSFHVIADIYSPKVVLLIQGKLIVSNVCCFFQGNYSLRSSD